MDAVLLIEVDSETDKLDADEREVRIKRKAFYRRLGCLEVERFDLRALDDEMHDGFRAKERRL